MKTIILESLLATAFFLFSGSYLVSAEETAKVSGFLFGEKEITIKAKSQGEITLQAVDEGTFVTAGTTLAIIDDRQEQTERSLAQVEYQAAEKDYNKTRKLGKYVSQEEIIQKKNEYLKKKSAVELKEYNLSNTKVISPIDGVITEKYFDVGETASVGDKVFEVVQLDKLYMEIHVASRDIGKLKKGQTVNFQTDLHKGRTFSAEVIYISPVINAGSDTVKVKLSVENQRLEDHSFELKPGTMTTVMF